MKSKPHPLTYGLPICLALFLLGCTGGPAPEEESTAPPVVERAINAHGMDRLDSVDMSFTFREREYTIERDRGRYRYTRTFTDSLGRRVYDEVTNAGLSRRINDTLTTLTPEDSAAYANSVNSVRYFMMLPYVLRDPAVRVDELPVATIDGKLYDRIRVTFAAEGGGEDHGDIYHYFFNRDTGELDYLAYAFDVNDGGLRFRRAINKRRVGGVLVQDYVNYGTDGEDRDIDRIVEKYAAGELPQLSVIENVDVRIR